MPVRRALRKLGQDMKDARRRRRIPTGVLADRASVSRATLVKIEKGDPSVALGLYATVLFALNMVDTLANLADVKNDAVGLQLEEENLPQRIRTGHSKGARD
jgi:DNA-binding XRE family transcriptional regulator